VFGPDLQGIENLAVQIETAIGDLPDTRSAFAEANGGRLFPGFRREPRSSGALRINCRRCK